MATVTKAQTLGTSKAKIICISGGKHCDLEMARPGLPHYRHALQKA